MNMYDSCRESSLGRPLSEPTITPFIAGKQSGSLHVAKIREPAPRKFDSLHALLGNVYKVHTLKMKQTRVTAPEPQKSITNFRKISGDPSLLLRSSVRPKNRN